MEKKRGSGFIIVNMTRKSKKETIKMVRNMVSGFFSLKMDKYGMKETIKMEKNMVNLFISVMETIIFSIK
tara:strand:+ start:343 stop:552 length:210 start_codon:yes stop_codon:yes gene_type:complete